jgi:hypothetical protein
MRQEALIRLACDISISRTFLIIPKCVPGLRFLAAFYAKGADGIQEVELKRF